MSTKTKLALAIALVLSTSSAVLAAPRHNTGQAQIPAWEQQWMDRASANTGGAETEIIADCDEEQPALGPAASF